MPKKIALKPLSLAIAALFVQSVAIAADEDAEQLAEMTVRQERPATVPAIRRPRPRSLVSKPAT